jgi:transcription initiation factor TFIID subunit TAF12
VKQVEVPNEEEVEVEITGEQKSCADEEPETGERLMEQALYALSQCVGVNSMIVLEVMEWTFDKQQQQQIAIMKKQQEQRQRAQAQRATRGSSSSASNMRPPVTLPGRRVIDALSRTLSGTRPGTGSMYAAPASNHTCPQFNVEASASTIANNVSTTAQAPKNIQTRSQPTTQPTTQLQLQPLPHQMHWTALQWIMYGMRLYSKNETLQEYGSQTLLHICSRDVVAMVGQQQPQQQQHHQPQKQKQRKQRRHQSMDHTKGEQSASASQQQQQQPQQHRLTEPELLHNLFQLCVVENSLTNFPNNPSNIV